VALTGTGTSSTTDLALNAAVTASSYTQTYVPANAVDGNTSTYWEANNGAWPSTITVNLGSDQTLGSITVDLPPSSAWSTRTQTLSVLGSTNGTSFSTLVASATYTWNPSTGNTVTIALPSGTKDQYVELSYTATSHKDREILKGSGGPETGREFQDRTWPRVSCDERTSKGDKKPDGDGSAGSNGLSVGFEIATKMQAGSVDLAAEADRKISRRCWRAKGRIERRASIGKDNGGRAPELRSEAGEIPAAGSKGPTSPPTECHVLTVHAGRRTS
jgi:hypothetical protein